VWCTGKVAGSPHGRGIVYGAASVRGFIIRKEEGMKYTETRNVGKAKYVISYYDGVKKHGDGSEFWDIRIFSNKKMRDAFIKTLVKA
jgi:hypothetical protein